MNFAELQREDQRLVILQLLLKAPGYSANESVMRAGLESFGHNISQHELAGVIDWLEDTGLVSTEKITSFIRVAVLTARGADVAEGKARHSGVRRPRPGE